jgi:hypothetical protein
VLSSRIAPETPTPRFCCVEMPPVLPPAAHLTPYREFSGADPTVRNADSPEMAPPQALLGSSP